MKIQTKTQYIIMNFASHYRAMTHSNIYCIRIYSSVLTFKNIMFQVDTTWMQSLHPPLSCSSINLSSSSLFHQVRFSAFVLFRKWLSFIHLMHFIIHSFHWHVQNVMIPCCSQELTFLSVMYFFLPPFSTNYSSILSDLILPSISWSTSQSCCSQIHIQYSFGNSIFFHSLYMPKPT